MECWFEGYSDEGYSYRGATSPGAPGARECGYGGFGDAGPSALENELKDLE